MRMFLFMTLVLGAAHCAVPSEMNDRNMFFMSVVPIRPDAYVWCLSLHLIPAMCAYVIWKEVTRHKEVTKALFFLFTYYTCEFIVNYYSFGVYFLGVYVNTYVAGACIFGFTILKHDSYIHHGITDFYSGRVRPFVKKAVFLVKERKL